MEHISELHHPAFHALRFDHSKIGDDWFNVVEYDSAELDWNFYNFDHVDSEESFDVDSLFFTVVELMLNHSAATSVVHEVPQVSKTIRIISFRRKSFFFFLAFQVFIFRFF